MAQKVSSAEVEKPGLWREKYVMRYDKHYFKDMNKVSGTTQRKRTGGEEVLKKALWRR